MAFVTFGLHKLLSLPQEVKHRLLLIKLGSTIRLIHLFLQHLLLKALEIAFIKLVFII